MSNLYDDYRKRFKAIFSNIDYLTYEERLELLDFLGYYLNLCLIRKFETGFKLT